MVIATSTPTRSIDGIVKITIKITTFNKLIQFLESVSYVAFLRVIQGQINPILI